MNAIQFIKDHGVEKAKKVLGSAGLLHKSYTPTGGLYHRYEMTGTVSLTELKRLVESVDLVKWHGGIKYAKPYLVRNKKEYPNAIGGWHSLEQAIADYEAIGGEHV